MKVCPKCKGRKTVIDKDDGRKKCETCDGKGFLILNKEL